MSATSLTVRTHDIASARIASERIVAASWSVAVDLLLGEPPTAWHPTVWMGRGISRARAWHDAAPVRRGRSLLWGAATAAAGAALCGTVAQGVARAVSCGRHAPLWLGLLLKPALSLRALLGAGYDVECALRAGDLPAARHWLAWHLVSRDTRALTAHEVASAAIASLAENLSDGFVAPLYWHARAGLGGAYAYRFVNTADAMLGYRTPQLEWFGKTVAHLDDLANHAPARLTARAIIQAVAQHGHDHALRAQRVMRNDARRTASPNAGWPMAAMAGALDVRIDKRRERSAHDSGPQRRWVYVLHRDGRPATVDDLARARHLLKQAADIALSWHTCWCQEAA